MPTSVTPNVTVRVLLFASYAEALGFETRELTVPSPATLSSVIAQLRALPGGDQLPLKPLCARNLAHAGADELLGPGDEIALLPPLAGG